MKLYLLVACAVLAYPIALDAKLNPRPKPRLDMKMTVEEIRAYCGITTGQFTYSDKSISVNYDGMIEPEKLDCASHRAVLLGIDFAAYDSSAPYSGPRRFLIKGPPKRLDSVAREAAASHWTVTHRADAGDGTAFLEIETGPTLSRRAVRDFLDQFLQGDFHDIAIGLAPRTLYGHDGPATETVFRGAARSMYGALGNRSCSPKVGFNREDLIQPERNAVALLEQELLQTAATAGQLAIAKEDAAFGQSYCWADDDIRFAKKHLEGDQQAVVSAIARLKELAPVLAPLSPTKSPANAPEFRNLVKELMLSVAPLCSWTSRGTNKAVLAATVAEIGRFEKSLLGSDYEVHFRIAKEDTAYDRAGVTAECDDPGPEPVTTLSDRALAQAKVQIAKLSKMLKSE